MGDATETAFFRAAEIRQSSSSGARETTRKRFSKAPGRTPHEARGRADRRRSMEIPELGENCDFPGAHPRAPPLDRLVVRAPCTIAPPVYVVDAETRRFVSHSPVSSRPGCGQLDFLPFSCKGCSRTFCLEHRTSHRCTTPATQVRPPSTRVSETTDLGSGCPPPPSRARRREMIPSPTDPSRLRSLSLRIPRAWCVPCAAAA